MRYKIFRKLPHLIIFSLILASLLLLISSSLVKIPSGAAEGSSTITTLEDWVSGTLLAIDAYSNEDSIQLTSSGGTWEYITSMTHETSLSDVKVIGANGKIYAFGGENTKDSVEEYDPDTGTWTTKTSMPSAMPNGATISSYGSKIYLIGGSSYCSASDQILEYDVITEAWTSKSPMTTPRGSASAVEYDGHIYVIGGKSCDIALPYPYYSLTVVERYNPSTDSWESLASMSTSRANLATAGYSGKIYALGGDPVEDGSIPGAQEESRAVEEYDISSNSWSSKANMLDKLRWLDADVLSNKIYVPGGHEAVSGIQDHLQEYDPTSDSWSYNVAMIQEREGNDQVEMVDGKICFFGGTSLSDKTVECWPNNPTYTSPGTHTSASTQLDSGVCDSSEWTTFVPDDTIPANTSIDYRFRTSADATTWGDWTASTPSAASIDISTLLGATDAAKRYLQVESTLANTDGVSTPTISAYTANYECTNTCDDFDHLDISPASITIDSGENTTITATPKDAADQTLEGITVSYSADCGSVDSNGVFTAPTVSEDTTCTVTATSECGGSETSTVTINVPDDPPPPGGCNNNGIQDNGETGVDCGGGGCDDCPITPEPPPPNPPGGCTNFSHLSISPSSLSICANDSAVITYYGVDTFGNIMSGLSEFLVVETGTLVGNRYTAPSQPGSYTMAASSICGNANGTITVRSCLPSPPPSPPPGPPPPGPPPGPPPPNCVGPDCECQGDICWCIGEDCTCSDPETCLPCVGEDCVCDPERMVCHCEGDECVCNDPDKCEGPEPVPPLPICIGSGCINIDPKIIEVAGSVSTAALGIAALVASLMQGLANVLTMIRPSQVWAYLLKGRDKKRAKGLVYDASSGVGIPLAKVLLFRSRDQKLIRVATTGSDGRFALETPPGEEYYLEIRKEGYETLSKTQAELSNSALAYDNNYQGETFRTDQAHLLFDKAVPLSANAESTKLALSARVFETITKVLRVINIPLLIFGFMMSTLAMIESKTPYNLVIFYLYLLIFTYYLIKLFIIDGRSFGVVTNQAKKDTVDLAIVRAISETRGKLAKTTVTNEKGRYTLVLPKGFYKIIVSKPGLKQKGNLSVRVKSNLRPRTEKIEMIEVGRGEPEVWDKKYEARKNQNTGKALVSSPITLNSQLHTSISQPPASSSGRSFSDSGEIVERFAEKSSRFGTNNLSDIGLHHLIMPKKMEEEISETNKEISNSSPNKKESDSDHPNWQLPNSSSPL